MTTFETSCNPHPDASAPAAQAEPADHPLAWPKDAAFDEWWDADRLTQTNPYREGSPAFWAWEGWQARAAHRAEQAGEVPPGIPKLRVLADEMRALLEWADNREAEGYRRGVEDAASECESWGELGTANDLRSMLIKDKP